MNPHFPVYLSLGSNIEPRQNLIKAVALLREEMEIVAIATVWETPAVGTAGPNFLNTALAARTSLQPETLKTTILRPIETRLGRVRSADKFAPRPIDLDIVLFDSHVVEPRIWKLAYLALPLAELIPDLLQPETGKTLEEVARELCRTTPAIPHPEIQL